MFKKIMARMDWVSVGILICFMLISTLNIYSVTARSNLAGMHVDHLIFYLLLFIPFFAVVFIDYRFVVKYLAIPSYIVGLILLVLVAVMGDSINNAQRWLVIAGIQFQPSEVVKISLILMLAYFLVKRRGERLRLVRDVGPMALIMLIPFAFVLKQPDLGTAIVFICIFCGMMWLGNVRMLHAVIGVTCIVSLVGTVLLLYFYNPELLEEFLSPHQIHRIETFLDPSIDPDKSYHVINAIAAIAYGELFGTGFQEGFYTQNFYVPIQYSDSIFVAVAEEFGFIGSAILLLLYFLLIYRMIMISILSRDLMGTYIVVGVTSMFVLQIFENIAMHIGLLPLTGIPLPFISYGRSSLLVSMFAVALVLSVKMHQDDRGTEDN